MRQLTISLSITNRNGDILDRYFNDIKKVDLISADDEAVLTRKIKQGDIKALQCLVKTNLRFVVSVAKKYQHQGLSMEDLINEGNIGLMNAAKRFDETKGFKFISYAVWWIRQSIIAAIAEQARLVHLPYNYIWLMGKYTKAANSLEQEYNRKPSTEEVAELMDIEVYKLNDLLNYYRPEISIDNPISPDSESTLLEIIPNQTVATDSHVLNESLKSLIKEALNVLNVREREIIQLYFGLNLILPVSLDDIAYRLNLSSEHTRRLKDSALLKIRRSTYASSLASCLG